MFYQLDRIREEINKGRIWTNEFSMRQRAATIMELASEAVYRTDDEELRRSLRELAMEARMAMLFPKEYMVSYVPEVVKEARRIILNNIATDVGITREWRHALDCLDRYMREGKTWRAADYGDAIVSRDGVSAV